MTPTTKDKEAIRSELEKQLRFQLSKNQSDFSKWTDHEWYGLSNSLLLSIKKPLSRLTEQVRAEVKEVCICAAIKFKSGFIARGHRHGDCFRVAKGVGIDTRVEDGEQGFITSKNRFVGRQEGRKLQEAAGIKSASPEGYQADTLFSEDLY